MAAPPPSRSNGWAVTESFGRIFCAEGAGRALAFLEANAGGDPAFYASVLSLWAGKLARLAAAGGEVTPDDEELAAECRARLGALSSAEQRDA